MPCGVEATWGEPSLDGLGEMLSPPPPSLSPGLRILSAVCKFQRIFFFFYNPSLFLVFQFSMCNTEGRPVCDLELASLFSHWALRPISFDDDDYDYDYYYYFLAIQGKEMRLTSQWLPTGLPISTDQPRILLASGICNSLLPTSSEGREEVVCGRPPGVFPLCLAWLLSTPGGGRTRSHRRRSESGMPQKVVREKYSWFVGPETATFFKTQSAAQLSLKTPPLHFR